MSPDTSTLHWPASAANTTVECAVADFTSVARGKIVSRADFDVLGGCRLPSVVFGVTLTGGEPEAVFGPLLPADYRDLLLVPDPATSVPVPGRADRISVICEPAGLLPRPGRSAGPAGLAPLEAADLSPRAALRRVLARLGEAGLQATVAPELEFFLVERRADGAGLRAAGVPGPSGSREQALEIASLERCSLFSGYFDALFAACECQRIPVTGHAHESAIGQYEVNFAPGEPLAMADAVWRFKRLARETAVRQGFLATFLAKPFADQPGTGMHWHTSLQRLTGGANAFCDVTVDGRGRDTATLGHFIGGLQAHAGACLALLAPWAHSFERLRRSDASPSDARWGEDDRGVAFRLPPASPVNRRVEHRLPGGDANPYLTLAALLGSGLLGIEQALDRRDDPPPLPASLPQALAALDASAALRGLLGETLVDLYVALKQHELAERAALADPWREWDLAYLLEQA